MLPLDIAALEHALGEWHHATPDSATEFERREVALGFVEQVEEFFQDFPEYDAIFFSYKVLLKEPELVAAIQKDNELFEDEGDIFSDIPAHRRLAEMMLDINSDLGNMPEHCRRPCIDYAFKDDPAGEYDLMIGAGAIEHHAARAVGPEAWSRAEAAVLARALPAGDGDQLTSAEPRLRL